MKECCKDFIKICKEDGWDVEKNLNYCAICGGKLDKE